MFPALQNKTFLSIGQFCDNGFCVLFDKDSVNVFKGDNSILGTRYPTNGLYYIALPTPTSRVHSEAHSAYDMTTKSDLVQFLHCAAFSPVVLTWTKSIDTGYFTTWPGLTSELVCKHLPKYLTTAKGHLKKTNQNVRSTKIVAPPSPPLVHDNSKPQV